MTKNDGRTKNLFVASRLKTSMGKIAFWKEEEFDKEENSKNFFGKEFRNLGKVLWPIQINTIKGENPERMARG